jgi:hypothetical protein
MDVMKVISWLDDSALDLVFRIGTESCERACKVRQSRQDDGHATSRAMIQPRAWGIGKSLLVREMHRVYTIPSCFSSYWALSDTLFESIRTVLADLWASPVICSWEEPTALELFLFKLP